MPSTSYFLTIDQGTTNSRAIIFDTNSHVIASHEIPLQQSFPQPGWVEQNPDELFTNTVLCCQHALKKANLNATQIAAIGISNQRETTIIWDKHTGKAIYPAIVWQDRRTAEHCKKLIAEGFENDIYNATGLIIDPYFSATKIHWILDNVAGARKRCEQNELLFGTVECFLLWKLTNGKSFYTDATNASRTMLFNIHTQLWDSKICAALKIPLTLLPTVVDNVYDYGKTSPEYFGAAIQISAMAGDQQAATIGQACFYPGMMKATYGTGGFIVLNTGDQCIASHNRLLSTIAYRINDKVCYALEGSIFCAGTTIKWLRDMLHLIDKAQESETFARHVNSTEGVYLVPAFTGLGAPYWDPHARAAITGMTRNTSKQHIVRAALESVAYQTYDLLGAMISDYEAPLHNIRVDGGMAANNWLLQFLSDILQLHIQRPHCIETSALGVAYLAGLQQGIYKSLDEIADHWQSQATFTPSMYTHERNDLYEGWKTAVNRVLLN